MTHLRSKALNVVLAVLLAAGMLCLAALPKQAFAADNTVTVTTLTVPASATKTGAATVTANLYTLTGSGNAGTAIGTADVTATVAQSSTTATGVTFDFGTAAVAGTYIFTAQVTKINGSVTLPSTNPVVPAYACQAALVILGANGNGTIAKIDTSDVTASALLAVNVHPVLSLSGGNAIVTADFTAAGSGATSAVAPTSPSAFSITTNNALGYSLAASLDASSANLLGQTTNSDTAGQRLVPYSGTTQGLASGEHGAWGYQLDGAGNWLAMPATSTAPVSYDNSDAKFQDGSGQMTTQPALLKHAAVPAVGDTVSVKYGFTVDGSLAADTYTGKVIYTLVPNLA